MPDRCNEADNESAPCKLRVQHWRERKTGPQFALLVVKCETHGVAFTLYPPGHVPYGRVAVAAVDREGRPLRRGDDRTELAWEQTLFGAAVDGAGRIAWPRTGAADGSLGSWRTQGRYIAQAAELLGLTEIQEPVLVGPLGVSELGQREAAGAYGRATGYETRGLAICTIVQELELVDCDLLDMILFAGFAAGRWGRARRWDAREAQLRDVGPRARSP
ncbi:MAG: hypothetical protein JRH20_24010 [Deltaproteobacteria bacterium]|nr:hypothetical protein [Deltaproteobacteria bacterium]